MTSNPPDIICVTGVDGSGKSCLTDWLTEYLVSEGYDIKRVWSRFNNYTSKPLLALTRLTGHNRRFSVNNIKYGFHDFENLYIYRELYAILQALDTNIAAYAKITRFRKKVDYVICERSPWDTLIDVMADTDTDEFIKKYLLSLFLYQVRGTSLTLFIDRDYHNIIETRPELSHDYKMEKKISLYRKTAMSEHWNIINNNGSIDETRRQITDVFKAEKIV